MEFKFDKLFNKLELFVIIFPGFRIFLGELLGTFILVLFESGANANMVFSEFIHELPIMGKGAAMFIGMLASYPLSGGHMNPAVTIAFIVIRKCRLLMLPFYIGAQYLGAYIAAIVLHSLYKDTIEHRVKNLDTRRMIWIIDPHPEISIEIAVVDLIVTTCIFVFFFLLIRNVRNSTPTRTMIAGFSGLLYALMGFAFYYNTGCPMNPARDLIPRWYVKQLGYSIRIFKPDLRNYDIKVLIGTHLGAIIGALIYYFIYEVFLKPSDRMYKYYCYPTKRPNYLGRSRFRKPMARCCGSFGKCCGRFGKYCENVSVGLQLPRLGFGIRRGCGRICKQLRISCRKCFSRQPRERRVHSISSIPSTPSIPPIRSSRDHPYIVGSFPSVKPTPAPPPAAPPPPPAPPPSTPPSDSQFRSPTTPPSDSKGGPPTSPPSDSSAAARDPRSRRRSWRRRDDDSRRSSDSSYGN